MRLSMLIFSISISMKSWSFCRRSYGDGGFQQLLFLGGGDEEVGGQGVGEAVRIFELERGHDALEGQVMRHLRVLLEDLHQLLHVLRDFRRERVFGVDLADGDGDEAVGFGRADDLSAGPSTMTFTF